jgi:hypothetical protein
LFLRGVQAHVLQKEYLQKLFAKLTLISEKAKEAKPIFGFTSSEKQNETNIYLIVNS